LRDLCLRFHFHIPKWLSTHFRSSERGGFRPVCEWRAGSICWECRAAAEFFLGALGKDTSE
jgi:hypothetical protein